MNILQSKSLDLFNCSKHVKRIKSVIADHRQNADILIKELLEEAESIGFDLSPPRTATRQHYRSNHPSENSMDYWKRSLLIPYLDSLISSLEERFSDDNSPAFSLLSLHPSNMLKKSVSEIISLSKDSFDLYDLKNLENEVEVWYALWKDKELDTEQLKNLELAEIIKETDEFFPCVKEALAISLAQPCTTCTIERSFSTLRRVKTWLRSVMIEHRLNGLCMLSVHRQMINGIKHQFSDDILNRFAENPRKMILK